MRALLLANLVVLAACSKKQEAPPPAKTPPATATTGTVGADGVRSVPIEAGMEGYKPDTIPGKPGEKLKLVFTRVEDTECGAQVKVDGGKAVDLPMNQPVEIAVTAPASGKLTFVCGMDMMQGAIIVGS